MDEYILQLFTQEKKKKWTELCQQIAKERNVTFCRDIMGQVNDDTKSDIKQTTGYETVICQ